MTDAG